MPRKKVVVHHHPKRITQRWWLLFLVHALGIPIIHGAMQSQPSSGRLLREFAWFQNKPAYPDRDKQWIEARYNFTDAEAQKILTDHVSPESVSDKYKPVILLCDGAFAGCGSLYQDQGWEFVLTVRHLFCAEKPAKWTYQILRPFDSTTHPIAEVYSPVEKFRDYAICIPGPAAPLENKTRAEDLLLNRPVWFERAEPSGFTSLLTGKRYVSDMAVLNKVDGQHFTRPAFFGNEIIHQGESGTLFLDDKGQAYVHGSSAALTTEVRDQMAASGCIPPRDTDFAQILERFPMEELFAD